MSRRNRSPVERQESPSENTPRSTSPRPDSVGPSRVSSSPISSARVSRPNPSEVDFSRRVRMSYAATRTSAVPGSGRPIEPGLPPPTLARIVSLSVDA